MRPSLVILFCLVKQSLQHARLMEPPSRASMWRLGYPTPVDQDDNQSYCGGLGIQHGMYQGKCGICGDPWGDFPRDHEAPGGIYATGIIVKTYKQGSYIPVIVDITANHQGHFEFKICPNNDIFVDPDQSCFDSRLPLKVGNPESDPMTTRWRTKYPILDYETGLRLVYVQLPLDIDSCSQCILQWSYRAGNNWGRCSDGSEGMGCGPQETFRGCADIAIVPHPLLSAAKTAAQAIDRASDAEEVAFTPAAPQKLQARKRLLEKVMKHVKQLILKSYESGPDESTPREDLNAIGPSSPSMRWGKITSNRH